jgi:nucleotide-binding universal stress UspA family protein
VRRAARLLGLLALLAAGCGKTTPATEAERPAALLPEQFVEVYVDLRRAAHQAETPEQFDALKREVLRRHGLTAQALLDFANAHGADLDKMSALWDTIRDRLSAADSAAAGGH